MENSSATLQRWEIPNRCPRCSADDTVEIIEFGPRQETARVKCKGCSRVWWIDATPVYKVADDYQKKYNELRQQILSTAQFVNRNITPDQHPDLSEHDFLLEAISFLGELSGRYMDLQK